MRNRNRFVGLASGAGLTMLAAAFIGVQMQDDPAHAQPTLTKVDPAVAFCKAGMTHHQQVVSAAIIDTKSGKPIYTWGVGVQSELHASLVSDVRYAVDVKTGDTAGLFYVNKKGSYVESCDVGNKQYSVEP